VTALVGTAAWTSEPANRETVLSLWAKSGTPIEALRAEQEGQSFQRRYSPLLDEFFVERYRATVQESRELGLQKLWAPYDAGNRPIVR